MGKLNEKRIELNNPYPVKIDEIVDIVERSSRLTHTATDGKQFSFTSIQMAVKDLSVLLKLKLLL